MYVICIIHFTFIIFYHLYFTESFIIILFRFICNWRWRWLKLSCSLSPLWWFFAQGIEHHLIQFETRFYTLIFFNFALSTMNRHLNAFSNRHISSWTLYGILSKWIFILPIIRRNRYKALLINLLNISSNCCPIFFISSVRFNLCI